MGNATDDLNAVFSSGKIFDASNEELNEYLRHLSSNYVANDGVRHREVIRGLTINTIKTFRYIDLIQEANLKVQKTNSLYTKIIIGLTVITVLTAFFSIKQSVSSSKQIQRLIEIEHSQLIEMREVQPKNNP